MKKLLLPATLLALLSLAGSACLNKKLARDIGALDVSQGLNPNAILKGVEVSGFLAAPPEQVFAWCTKTANFRKFFPGDRRGMRPDDSPTLAAPGDSFALIMGGNAGGISVPGRMVVTQIEPNRSLEVFFVGTLWVRATFFLEPAPGGSRITFRSMYQWPETLQQPPYQMFDQAFDNFAAWVWKHNLTKLPQWMGLPASREKIETGRFSVLCNSNRIEQFSALPVDAAWEKLTRRDSLALALAPAAALTAGDERLDALHKTLTFQAPADSPSLTGTAVVVQALPSQRLHASLELSGIRGGIIVLLTPHGAGSRIETLLYYELPSDEAMPPELFAAFAALPAELEAFLARLLP